MRALSSSGIVLMVAVVWGSASGCSCGDNGQTAASDGATTASSTSSAAGGGGASGSTTGGGRGGSRADGGGGATSEGGGGATGAGGTGGTGGGGGSGGGGGAGGGTGGGGAPAFGPCHGFSDDFQTFDPTSSTDPWDVDDLVTAVGTTDKSLLVAPDADLYAGLITTNAKVVRNCFTSVSTLGPQGDGFYVLQILDGSGSGKFVEIQVLPGQYVSADIVDGAGNGTNVAMGPLTGDIQAMRIQVYDDHLVFEVKDDLGWEAAGTLAPAPDWFADPAYLSFGYRRVEPGALSVTFDDFNVEAP